MDESTAQRSADCQAIGQVLRDYAWAIDRKDFPAVHGLLAPDARARFGADRDWMNGADGIVAMLTKMVEPAGWQMHSVVIEDVALDGDTAVVRAALSAYQTMTADPSTLVTVLGRYHARFVRGDGRWQLAELDFDRGWAGHSRKSH